MAPKPSDVDLETVQYFDRETPEYSSGRLAHVIPFIWKHATNESTLLDIGCGVGNLLEEVQKRTPIQSVTGIDISKRCLEQTRNRLRCPVFLGSVLDTDFIESIGSAFDFVVLASILHHLVGKTRRQCKRNFVLAMANALRVTLPGGHIIVFEPGISPRLAGFSLFYAKRFVTRFTSGRVQLFDKWNNIGAPVISYFTHGQVTTMALKSEMARLVERHIEDMHVNFLWRVFGVMRRTNTTLVIERRPDSLTDCGYASCKHSNYALEPSDLS
jgi:SAM-dependent methyltransferase